MNLLTEPVGVAHFMVVGAILFASGVVCMAVECNALGVLMGIELVLNGANINFVDAGSKFLQKYVPSRSGSTVTYRFCSSSCWPPPKRPWRWRSP